MATDLLPAFHIGANKAGSTTLQKSLFSKHSQILNLGKPEPHRALLDDLNRIARACEQGATIPIANTANWQSAVVDARGRVPVFSHEELIRPHLYNSSDPEQFARAVHAMTGPLRVIIVARHQIKLIESLYIHKANSSNYKSFDAWLAELPEWHAYGYGFHAIAMIWQKVVGQDNVKVLLFEELAVDPQRFARRLCDFLGIDANEGSELLQGRHENVRKSARVQAYAKLRSGLLPSIELGRLLPPPIRRTWRAYLEGGHLAKASIPAEWRDKLLHHYSQDNQQLATRFDLPLREYGYPL
jgi:hypothetical protein